MLLIRMFGKFVSLLTLHIQNMEKLIEHVVYCFKKKMGYVAPQ